MAAENGGEELDDLSLGSLRNLIQQKETENMDLKIENAHLRERLISRADGDVDVMNLEEENFELKKNLFELQSQLQEVREQLCESDGNYRKALTNMMKLDEAWRNCAHDVRQLKEEKVAMEKVIKTMETDAKDQSERFQNTEESQLETISKQENQLKNLHTKYLDNEKQLQLTEKEKGNLHLRVQELQSQLIDTQVRNSDKVHESKQNHGVLEDQLQVSVEECAKLRGQTRALQVEIDELQGQYTNVKQSYSISKSRLLQLTEENSSLAIQLKASKNTIERFQEEKKFFTNEIHRLQEDINEHKSTILKNNDHRQELEELIEKQKKIEVQKEHDYERILKRNELVMMKSGENQLEVLKDEARQLKNTILELEDQKAIVEEEHRQIESEVELASTGNGGKERLDILRQSGLLCLVKHELLVNESLNSENLSLRQQRGALEKKVQKLHVLTLENEKLHAAYDKTKKAMERIVLRKQKCGVNVGVNPSKGLSIRNVSDKENLCNATLNQSSIGDDKSKRVSLKRKLSDDPSKCVPVVDKKSKQKHVVVKSRYMQSITR